MRGLNPWFVAAGALLFAFVVVCFAIFYLRVPSSEECRLDALHSMCSYYAGGYGDVSVVSSSRGFVVDCGSVVYGESFEVNISFNSGLQ